MALSKITNAGIGTVDDITLSGGVYLGGTGSANYLNDYEEGTWTPDPKFGGGNTGMTLASGYYGTYTKIGRLVTVNFRLAFSSLGSSTGDLQIYGLPFTPITSSNMDIGSLYATNLDSSSGWRSYVIIRTDLNNTFLEPLEMRIDAGGESKFSNTEILTTGGMAGTITYETS